MFDGAAEGYDRARRQLVPRFDGFYRAAVEALLYRHEDEIRVLDLGAGTGILSAFVARAFPRARITLVDASSDMLGVARRRFENEPARFELLVKDYPQEPLPGGEYDAGGRVSLSRDVATAGAREGSEGGRSVRRPSADAGG